MKGGYRFRRNLSRGATVMAVIISSLPLTHIGTRRLQNGVSYSVVGRRRRLRRVGAAGGSIERRRPSPISLAIAARRSE